MKKFTSEKDLLKQLIKENINRMVLYEGLIYSYAPSFIIPKIKKSGFDKVFYDSKRNIFSIEFKLGKDNKERFESLDKFLDDVCGWFHGSTVYNNFFLPDKNSFLLEKKGVANLQYEAKFDIKIEKIPKELYHLTKTKNLSNVLKKGLIPKSSIQFFNYKDRIYLSTNVNSLIDLASQKNFIVNDKQFTILKIDGTKLNYGIRFFKDPNFENGLYTLENIHPNFLKPVIELNFDENNNITKTELK
jgi:hypothetical protein